MKRLFTITLLCLGISVSANAQWELQFGQVRLIEFEVNSAGYHTHSFSVPEGKVLKLEWASAAGSPDGGTTWTSGSSFVSLKLDDYAIVNGGSDHAVIDMPIWLPTGTYELRLGLFQATMGKARLSAIEFNVEQ